MAYVAAAFPDQLTTTDANALLKAIPGIGAIVTVTDTDATFALLKGRIHPDNVVCFAIMPRKAFLASAEAQALATLGATPSVPAEVAAAEEDETEALPKAAASKPMASGVLSPPLAALTEDTLAAAGDKGNRGAGRRILKLPNKRRAAHVAAQTAASPGRGHADSCTVTPAEQAGKGGGGTAGVATGEVAMEGVGKQVLKGIATASEAACLPGDPASGGDADEQAPVAAQAMTSASRDPTVSASSFDASIASGSACDPLLRTQVQADAEVAAEEQAYVAVAASVEDRRASPANKDKPEGRTRIAAEVVVATGAPMQGPVQGSTSGEPTAGTLTEAARLSTCKSKAGNPRSARPRWPPATAAAALHGVKPAVHAALRLPPAPSPIPDALRMPAKQEPVSSNVADMNGGDLPRATSPPDQPSLAPCAPQHAANITATAPLHASDHAASRAEQLCGALILPEERASAATPSQPHAPEQLRVPAHRGAASSLPDGNDSPACTFLTLPLSTPMQLLERFSAIAACAASQGTVSTNHGVSPSSGAAAIDGCAAGTAGPHGYNGDGSIGEQCSAVGAADNVRLPCESGVSPVELHSQRSRKATMTGQDGGTSSTLNGAHAAHVSVAAQSSGERRTPPVEPMASAFDSAPGVFALHAMPSRRGFGGAAPYDTAGASGAPVDTDWVTSGTRVAAATLESALRDSGVPACGAPTPPKPGSLAACAGSAALPQKASESTLTHRQPVPLPVVRPPCEQRQHASWHDDADVSALPLHSEPRRQRGSAVSSCRASAELPGGVETPVDTPLPPAAPLTSSSNGSAYKPLFQSPRDWDGLVNYSLPLFVPSAYVPFPAQAQAPPLASSPQPCSRHCADGSATDAATPPVSTPTTTKAMRDHVMAVHRDDLEAMVADFNNLIACVAPALRERVVGWLPASPEELADTLIAAALNYRCRKNGSADEPAQGYQTQVMLFDVRSTEACLCCRAAVFKPPASVPAVHGTPHQQPLNSTLQAPCLRSCRSSRGWCATRGSTACTQLRSRATSRTSSCSSPSPTPPRLPPAPAVQLPCPTPTFPHLAAPSAPSCAAPPRPSVPQSTPAPALHPTTPPLLAAVAAAPLATPGACRHPTLAASPAQPPPKYTARPCADGALASMASRQAGRSTRPRPLPPFSVTKSPQTCSPSAFPSLRSRRARRGRCCCPPSSACTVARQR
jgi:hypothetical protein